MFNVQPQKAKYLQQIIIAIMLLLLSSASFAKKLKSEKSVLIFTDSVMEDLVKSDLISAIDKLKSVLNEHKQEVLTLESRDNRNQLATKYGKPLSFEFIKTTKISSSLLVVQYIENLQKAPVIWKFLFYKIKKEWKLQAVNWDDSINKNF